MDSESLTLQLPVPDRALSPNARVHWSVKGKAVSAARVAAAVEANRVLFERRPPMPPPRWEKARCHAVLFHKGKRTPDPDNFVASLKPYLDGIADAGLMANDRNLWPERPEFRQVSKMPRVEITISPES